MTHGMSRFMAATAARPDNACAGDHDLDIRCVNHVVRIADCLATSSAVDSLQIY
jgi:hypothetical protein